MTTLCLIVEDSSAVRKAIKRIIEEFSFEIVETENGQEALDFCLKRSPDVIILDWNMPVMNGIEFLRALRKTDKGSSPKVIFCTTENNMAHIQEAIESGADEYIMKPFDKDIIQEKLEQVGIL